MLIDDPLENRQDCWWRKTIDNNMNNFIFKNPVKLIFGKGEISRLSKELPKDSTIMVTYGGGSIFKNGVMDQVRDALEGRKYFEFGGIEANPEYETLMKAVDLAKKQKVSFILAVGGGSVIDGTKFIAAATAYNGDNAWDLMINRNILKEVTPVPFGTVLTLPATASEMNNGAVISRREFKEKLSFSHAANFPQFSILDPEVCYSLPKRQISNGIVDTYVHILEQYLTFPTQSMIQDRFSESVLITLKEIGERLYTDHRDYDLCANFMLCATMGLNGFTSMGVPEDWATHMIGHELTAFYGLDHAQTLAIVGPSLMNVMKSEKWDKLLQYGERVFGIDKSVGTEEQRVDAAIAATRDFYERVGIRTHLSDYNISDGDFEVIADRFRHRGWMLGENASITPEKIVEILKGAL